MPTVNLGRVKGDAATITAGTITIGTPESTASVTNSGTLGDAVFDFNIPRGFTGEKGDKGDQGDIGPSIESLVINETATARTLALTDINQYIRCSHPEQTTITVPLDTAVGWSLGDVVYFRRVSGAGPIFISTANGITVSGEQSQTILENQNFAIKRVGTNSWDLI